MILLKYQIDQGEFRGKKQPEQVSRRPCKATQEALEYVTWFSRTELPIDMQILILDLIANRPLPPVLNLEFTNYTPAVCDLMFQVQGRQATELLITLGSSDIQIAHSINNLKLGLRVDEEDITNYRFFCWNLPSIRRVALAGYLSALGQEILRTKVIQGPLGEPLAWSYFASGLEIQPLETYAPVVRALSGSSPVQADLINLEVEGLNRLKVTRHLQLAIHAGFNTMSFFLQRGMQDSAYKYLTPLKNLVDIANKLDIDILRPI